VAFSLSLGTVGYHVAAGLDWVDAFLNASMILTGMGQVDVLRTPTAKVFAALYALYSGIVFLLAASVCGAGAAPDAAIGCTSRTDRGRRRAGGEGARSGGQTRIWRHRPRT